VRWLRQVVGVGVAWAALYFALWPGLTVTWGLWFDGGARGPGTPRLAFHLHEKLSPEYARYARERVESGAAAEVDYRDISATEWPLFGSMFYLLATESLQEAWERDRFAAKRAPKEYARDAIEGALALVLDANHAAWVQRHWGEKDYLTKENVFYRMLVMFAIGSHHRLTGSDEHFWKRNWLAAGFREFPRGDEARASFYFDVDAGPVAWGFGTAATAFGMGAARTNGRFDHAFPLYAELLATSWPLPSGTLLLPRTASNREHAPFLGETAILFQLSREPIDGAAITPAGPIPGAVYLILGLYLVVGIVFLRFGLWLIIGGKRRTGRGSNTMPDEA
jgi:hypothetical protein